MKQKNKSFTPKSREAQHNNPPVVRQQGLSLSNFKTFLPALILGLTLLLVPLYPDEKLNRLKLIAFGVGLVLASVAWAFTKISEKSWIFYRTPLDPYMMVYFISAVLYYKSSANPSVASSEFQRMIFSVGAFFIAVQASSGEQGRRLRKIILSGWMPGLFLISVYGILQRNGGIGRIMVPQMERVFGTFGNSIFFAAFLILSIPVTLAWLLQTEKTWQKVLLLFPLFTAGAALFYTETRAAFLALPISLLFFYLIVELCNNWRWSRRVWQFRLRVCAVLSVLIILLGIDFLGARFFFSGRTSIAGKMGSALYASRMTATHQTHTLIWKDVFKMWKAHKWFGTGYGTFHIEFPQYASEELKQVYPQHQRIVNDAHNEYLQILAETGMVGFLIFSSLIAFFYFNAARFLRSLAGNAFEPGREDVILFAGLLSGITALLIENIFSVDMRFIISSTYLFLTMGLAASFFAGFSTPVHISWASGQMSLLLKCAWAAFFLLFSGILGIGQNPKGFFVAGIYRFSANEQGIWGWQKTAAMGPGLIPSLIRPYVAQNILNKTPDFFDEKLLNSAQTINDLENLTRQFPEQWRYWEKLGFALAKEIQRKTADGSKMNDRTVAERAVAAYKKAHELNPQAEGPVNNLGNIYYTLGQRQEAIEWWKKAISVNPDRVDSRLNLGLAYYYEGKIKESALQFEEVLKRDPKNDKALVMLKRMVE